MTERPAPPRQRPRRDMPRENSDSDFSRCSTEELKQIVRAAVGDVDGGVGRTTAAVRGRLLPALLVLQQRIAHGEWEKFLKSANLKPATVRKWRCREREATNDLARLLGEPSRRRKPNGEMPRSAAHELAEFGYKLAKAVLANRNSVPPSVASMAEEFIEAYEQAA